MQIQFHIEVLKYTIGNTFLHQPHLFLHAGPVTLLPLSFHNSLELTNL